MFNLPQSTFGRRSFLRFSALSVAAGSFLMNPISKAVAQAVKEIEPFYWNACVINCGQRCPQRCFVKGGQVIRVETDNTAGDACDHRQIRACLRGRALRQRLYSPDRLKYPMKRVGERGEGKFERITWDEAIKTVADNLKRTVEKYGNESVYWQYCSGQKSLVNSRRAWWRLLNLMGGYLKYYGSYSTAQIGAAMPYTYGGRPGSDMSEIGNGIVVHRVDHDGFRMTFFFSAFELIKNNWVDQDFLDKYCVGYDEKTLPASAAKGSDYKSHILGKGKDGIAKTPEWAAKITGIPVETIVQLAKEMGTTKPCFVSQGWGPQRQANGEETARAIAMLPILLGQVGLPGTNPGDAEGNSSLPAVYLPIGKNPVKDTIPVFMWTDAIVRGKDMTDITDGMRGVKKLDHDIKMIVNSGGNTTINQHSDSNATDKILRDTSKCEFIVVCDNMMTPTCRYADILLPDVLGPETDDIACQGGSNGGTTSMLPMHKAVEPQWDQKTSYEICRLIAKELGKEQEFTEGRTQLQWLEWCYNETRKKVPQLPDWDTFWKGGPAQVYGWRNNPVALSEFRADPAKNPLKTPSGKIEIYSERLNNIANTWKLNPGDVISPIPIYFRNWEMYGDELQKKYPLQCYGFHHHGRIHSTFHNLP